MDRLILKVDFFCQGARLVTECYNPKDLAVQYWHKELLHCIRREDLENACIIAEQHLYATFEASDVNWLEDNEILLHEVGPAELSEPIIEKSDDVELLGCRWIGVTCLFSAPLHIVQNWMIELKDGSYVFDGNEFTSWVEDAGDNCRLQDGIRYYFGPFNYDQDGFGENGASIDEAFINNSFNEGRRNR